MCYNAMFCKRQQWPHVVIVLDPVHAREQGTALVCSEISKI